MPTHDEQTQRLLSNSRLLEPAKTYFARHGLAIIPGEEAKAVAKLRAEMRRATQENLRRGYASKVRGERTRSTATRLGAEFGLDLATATAFAGYFIKFPDARRAS